MADWPDTIGACHHEIEPLRDALVRRDVIGQAKGVLMARENLTGAEAFAILIHASQHQNRKLHDVANDVVQANNARAEAAAPSQRSARSPAPQADQR